MSDRFLYSVHPRRPIKNLSETVPLIRVNKSLTLAKEEVLICLKSAVVYRRFANEKKVERVTTANIDRLHNAKYMTEDEYKEFLKKEVLQEVSKPLVAETKKEEVLPEAPVMDEQTSVEVKEEAVVEEIVPEVTEEKKETIEEEVKEEDTKEEVSEEMETDGSVTGTVTDYDNSVLPQNTSTNKPVHYNKSYSNGKNKNNHR